MQQQLNHYSKHKHLTLISWLLHGYINAENIQSVLSVSDGQERSRFPAVMLKLMMNQSKCLIKIHSNILCLGMTL